MHRPTILSPSRVRGPVARARRAFTLMEMIVVMGIIVLIVVIAVPAIRSLTGSRSVDAGYNTLAALITRAREEAVGLQEVRGVLFYLDPTSDRVTAAIVKSVPIGTDMDQQGKPDSATYYLDLVPDRDFLTLPPGIGVQVVNDPGNTSTSYKDKYIGYNPIQGLTPAQATPALFGGVLLFDGNGRLISKSYGLKLRDTSVATPVPTQLAIALGYLGPLAQGYTAAPSADYTPLPVSPQPTPPVFLSSQFGFVLFDREAFKTQGFTDGDTNPLDPNVASYGTGTVPDEASEEQWLDNNATPILINRYNGTLIRAE